MDRSYLELIVIKHSVSRTTLLLENGVDVELARSGMVHFCMLACHHASRRSRVQPRRLSLLLFTYGTPVVIIQHGRARFHSSPWRSHPFAKSIWVKCLPVGPLLFPLLRQASLRIEATIQRSPQFWLTFPRGRTAT